MPVTVTVGLFQMRLRIVPRPIGLIGGLELSDFMRVRDVTHACVTPAALAAADPSAHQQALAALAPKTAFVLKKGKVFEVPADTLQPGQFVQVQPGGRVPADGTILEGQSSLDDSPVTGAKGSLSYAGLRDQVALLAGRQIAFGPRDEVLVARYIDEAYGGHGTTRLLGLRSGAGTQEPS